MLACAVCGYDKPKSALPLTWEEGVWVVKPVCDKCRRGLHSEARVAGKFIQFFGLDGSLAEAERRNAKATQFRPFLDAFAKAKRAEAKAITGRKNGDKRALTRVEE
jgi:hypothetical protein